MVLAYLSGVSSYKKLLSLILFVSFSTVGFSQSCVAELSVEKNRSAKSADEDGAVFWLTLTNKSSRTQTFTLSTVNLQQSCSTMKQKVTKPNVDLDVTVIAERASSNSLTLTAGSSGRFSVRADVPLGTTYDTWSCIEVQALSEDCPSPSAKTVLKVYVPDPSEE